MEPACFAASPLPLAWLQGDVLAEYLRFLEEAAPSPPPMRVPVAWLRGDVLAEYLRFPEEAAPRVAWLEGEVRDEFLRFLEESRAAAAAVGPDRQEEEEHRRGRAARDSGGDVDGYDDGCLVVDDDHRSFVDDGGEGGFMDHDGDVGDDANAMEDDEESEDGGDYMEKDEQEAEAVFELLLPHILDLSAFKARAAAAAPVQQEPALGFPLYLGGGCNAGFPSSRWIAAARLVALTLTKR